MEDYSVFKPVEGIVKSGIERASVESGNTTGALYNQLNTRFEEIAPYLASGYVTPAGKELTREERVLLVKTYCLNDEASFNELAGIA